MKLLLISLCVVLAADNALCAFQPFPSYVSAVLDSFTATQSYGKLKEDVGILSKVVCYLGMKYGDILDEQLSTSSDWNPVHAGRFARLDNQIVNGVKTGAWSAKHNRVDEWIQIDLGKPTSISGIITQGRPKVAQWVTKYKVQCGMQSSKLTFVDGGKEFMANKDMESHVHNIFSKSIVCRYVRIYPTAWNRHISMRLELVKGGCGKLF